MVSRRAFLAGSGAVTAGSLGLVPGLTTAAQAVVSSTSGSPARLLPVFNRPRHLDYGDVSKLSGGDQTLLTTLQGIVNRTEPELYFLYDTGTVSVPDAKWLADMHLPTKLYKNPLDLVAKYRSRIRGAIVHDPDVPDSLNVATTLAGLENAVVADADQAKAHGLKIVQDLRGMFDDDRVKTYRWQLDNLFPKVTHKLLAGLPPTRVVDVEGVQWQEIARETRQIRDSSNRGTYNLDVSSKLGKEAVYVRFADSFTDDGWGASILHVVVTANGAEIARFEPNSPEEAPYLFDGSHSSIGGEGNRFADGGNYWIYRFEPPAGTTSLVVTVEMWNQYLVSATDTSPTRIEPFPYFRDYVVATKALVSWLPPGGATGDLLIEHYAKYPTLAPYMGWFANDVSGEWDGVDLASKGGSPVVAADFYMNGTVHAGFTAPISDKPRPVRRIDKPKNKVYVTLTFGEGDNIQYCQRRLREIWDDPKRGQVPTNWTISPLLAETGPGLYSYFQRTATSNDLLVCGPSGGGYTYPASWKPDELTQYLKMTGGFMSRTGLDVVYAYSGRQDGKWILLSEEIASGYAEYTPTKGIMQTWDGDPLTVRQGGLPITGGWGAPGKAAEFKAALDQRIANWDGASPLFVSGLIGAWSWTPSDMAELGALLTDPYEVILANSFYDLLNRVL
ncbi:GxGYxY motif-containing protein [Kribbella sp. VKM Ac-2571]|uniref:GxGYxYP domain-containing protein n=1 Tax=Kribbella sp. VKM Ac-2571 TaxID=2512222 RepID=UPI00105EEBB9|nr:GxGYxYP domain-containing protein [Kribbella sp. VKM Ac-2571]TDO52828.1 GxGYxY motif-containing protein [Kribbella sp. VKM Ac-2571]